MSERKSGLRLTRRGYFGITGRLPWERELRLWSGLVLFLFVTTHLLNHALGVFGLAVMEAVQVWRIAAWQSWPGTILLYGAFLCHITFTLKRLTRRRTARMPFEEVVQILLGLLVPYLLVAHLSSTRISAAFFGLDEAYHVVISPLWGSAAMNQAALLLAAWSHGCIGISHAFRSKAFYVRWRLIWTAFVVLVPSWAFAGVLSAAREVAALPPRALSPELRQALGTFIDQSRAAFGAVLALMALLVVWREIRRRRGGQVTIRYTGHGEIKITRGTTMLEASRIGGIPHPSMCGGRGRCSACRIAVTQGAEDLPPPDAIERAMLVRLAAPANVRLACQTRPVKDLTAQILLPILPKSGSLQDLDEAYRWGAERDVTILFVDIRAFTVLTRRLLPYDLTLIINGFIKEMSQAVESHGGRVDSFMTDRLMATFGLADRGGGAGAAAAIRAARAMLKAAEAINKDFGAALPVPFRVGIGIHSGPAVIAEVGDVERGLLFTAMGDTVSIASRLQSATKSYLADCLISGQTVKLSGIKLPRHEGRVLHMQGLDEPISLYRLTDGADGVVEVDVAEPVVPDHSSAREEIG